MQHSATGEFGTVQTFAHLVDLDKCCKMNVYLQALVSIQQRTSAAKFAEPGSRALIWDRLSREKKSPGEER